MYPDLSGKSTPALPSCVVPGDLGNHSAPHFLLGTTKMLTVPASWAAVSIQWVNASKMLGAELSHSEHSTVTHSCFFFFPPHKYIFAYFTKMGFNCIHWYVILLFTWQYAMNSCSDRKTLFHSILSNYCRLNGGSTADLTNPLSLDCLSWSHVLCSKAWDAIYRQPDRSPNSRATAPLTGHTGRDPG